MRSFSKFLEFQMFWLLLVSIKCLAFPDTIRHGYTNCTTCHISPSGGGLLNRYGRSLSSELMSTWSYKNEELPLHGILPISETAMENFFFGGDTRYLSRKANSQSGTIDEGFLMQAQLRLGFGNEKVKFISSIGKIENPRLSQDVRIVGSEYYALYSPKDELYLRAGRFEPLYGLRLPDHNLWTKSEIGFVPWLERDTVEFIYEGEKQFISLAGYQSTSAVSTAQQQTGYAASFYQILGETSRLGLSGMNTEGQGVRTKVLSGHATIAFSDKDYTMIECSRVWNLESLKDVGLLRFGYEIIKGFTPQIQSQVKLDKIKPNSDQFRSGVGFSWLPRPHLEIVGLYENIQNSKGLSNESMLLVHYYF